MLWRWIILLLSFLYQLMSVFVQAYVFSTFQWNEFCFRCSSLLNKNFDLWIFWFWTFVLNFGYLLFLLLKLMQLLCWFEFWNKHWLNWTSLLVWGWFLQCHSPSAVFVRIKSVRILDLIICSKPLVSLFSPVWDAVKLACQEAVFICLLVTDEREWSCSGTNAWHPSTYLWLPDAEYPVFYPIGIS
jgi:hypothetical protein